MVASMATNRSMAPTICSAAIRQWEKDQKQKASKAQEVNLCFQWPPIEKMDNALAELVSCEKLVLSVNRIDKIAGTEESSLQFLINATIVIVVAFNK